jgi:hypothetical protein
MEQHQSVFVVNVLEEVARIEANLPVENRAIPHNNQVQDNAEVVDLDQGAERVDNAALEAQAFEQRLKELPSKEGHDGEEQDSAKVSEERIVDDFLQAQAAVAITHDAQEQNKVEVVDLEQRTEIIEDAALIEQAFRFDGKEKKDAGVVDLEQGVERILADAARLAQAAVAQRDLQSLKGHVGQEQDNAEVVDLEQGVERVSNTALQAQALGVIKQRLKDLQSKKGHDGEEQEIAKVSEERIADDYLQAHSIVAIPHDGQDQDNGEVVDLEQGAERPEDAAFQAQRAVVLTDSQSQKGLLK